MKENVRKYSLLYLAFFVYSGTTVFSKYAAIHAGLNFSFFMYLGLEVLCLGIYAILWQQVLKNMSLITAMSSKGIVVIIGLFWSLLLFDEWVSMFNVIGAAIIIAGIWVVTSDE